MWMFSAGGAVSQSLLSVPSLSSSAVVGGRFWFESDGPGVGGDDGAAAVDPAGVGSLVKLVSHYAQVSVFDDDVAGDGGHQLLSVFVPAEDTQTSNQSLKYSASLESFLYILL